MNRDYNYIGYMGHVVDFRKSIFKALGKKKFASRAKSYAPHPWLKSSICAHETPDSDVPDLMPRFSSLEDQYNFKMIILGGRGVQDRDPPAGIGSPWIVL